MVFCDVKLTLSLLRHLVNKINEQRTHNHHSQAPPPPPRYYMEGVRVENHLLTYASTSLLVVAAKIFSTSTPLFCHHEVYPSFKPKTKTTANASSTIPVTVSIDTSYSSTASFQFCPSVAEIGG